MNLKFEVHIKNLEIFSLEKTIKAKNDVISAQKEYIKYLEDTLKEKKISFQKNDRNKK